MGEERVLKEEEEGPGAPYIDTDTDTDTAS